MAGEWSPVLEACTLFQGMSAEQIRNLLPCLSASVRSCQKGDVLKLTGQAQNSFGLVLDGEVHVQQEDNAGNRLIIGIFGPGELFGEVSAFAGDGQWPNTVQASKRATSFLSRRRKSATHATRYARPTRS